ncbi:hypothetical protein BR93DRAFT_186162 [Coniochaeta sp. PMI_546]|nr:hypothetical protein BR93DRAFT_186162 [Coniochaeta sp. PMI_546]
MIRPTEAHKLLAFRLKAALPQVAIPSKKDKPEYAHFDLRYYTHVYSDVRYQRRQEPNRLFGMSSALSELHVLISDKHPYTYRRHLGVECSCRFGEADSTTTRAEGASLHGGAIWPTPAEHRFNGIGKPTTGPYRLPATPSCRCYFVYQRQPWHLLIRQKRDDINIICNHIAKHYSSIRHVRIRYAAIVSGPCVHELLRGHDLEAL